MKRRLFAIVLTPLVLVACGDEEPTGLEAGADVSVRFATAAAAQPGTGGALVLNGENGTLIIDDIKLIVAELELESEDGFCEEDDDDVECEEFEAAPFLLDLPPAGGDVTIATDEVPPGIFTELEFEIEDLEGDDDDAPSARAEIARIRTVLTATFGTLPAETSMIVSGRFIPAGSTVPQPFVVFFDADIEVEADIVPPLVVTTEGASRTLTVTLDLAQLFRTDGDVTDLSLFNGQLLSFEAEIEQGFEVEIDD